MSRSHPPIIPARHAQGLAAYRGGLTIAELVGITGEIDRMHEQATTNEEHEAIEASGPSLIAGYADGLIEDIRSLIGRPIPSRGHKA